MAQNFFEVGQRIDCLGTEIVCPALNNKPTAGDVVVVGAALVGVAENTAAATSDTIPVNTAGVYTIPVLGKTNGAVNSQVNKGDKLFVAVATAIVSKDTTGIPFGIAIGPVVAGAVVAAGVTTSVQVRLGTNN